MTRLQLSEAWLNTSEVMRKISVSRCSRLDPSLLADRPLPVSYRCWCCCCCCCCGGRTVTLRASRNECVVSLSKTQPILRSARPTDVVTTSPLTCRNTFVLDRWSISHQAMNYSGATSSRTTGGGSRQKEHDTSTEFAVSLICVRPNAKLNDVALVKQCRLYFLFFLYLSFIS